jgi:phosphoglycerate dehydrogenase-like enzyme
MRVLIHHDEAEPLAQQIAARHPDLAIATCETYEGLEAALAGHRPEAVFTIKFAGVPYPTEALLAAPALRWVHLGGAGFDHLLPWRRPDLILTTSAGLQGDAMAEYALGAFFALNHRIPLYQTQKAERRWQIAKPARVAAGTRLAILGLGRIGSRLAERAAAFGLEVEGLASRPRSHPHARRVVGPEGLHELLGGADAVVVLLPLTEQTRGLIEEQALAEALASGRLGGAALDVFAQEPLPPESPFWQAENVILTPHSAAIFEGWENACADLFCDNIERWRQGVPLINQVDPRRGY